MNIYIGNFDTQWTNDNLAELFRSYGTVDKAEIMMDGFTGRSRGFGYVEMSNEEEANQAISALNASEVNGLKLSVSKAEPRQERKGSYKVGNAGVNPYRFKRS